VLFFWQLDICIEKFKLSENVQNAVNGYLSVPLYRHHPPRTFPPISPIIWAGECNK